MAYLDPDLLRTFLAFADTGSLTKAADTVGRTASAVTAQMQKLEEVVGEPLFVPSGRGRELTASGLELVGYARSLLAANQEALLKLKGRRADGQITIAAVQDFAESGLPDLLRLFSQTHPRVRLDLRVGRTGDIREFFATGQADIALLVRGDPNDGRSRAVYRANGVERSRLRSQQALFRRSPAGPSGCAMRISQRGAGVAGQGRAKIPCRRNQPEPRRAPQRRPRRHRRHFENGAVVRGGCWPAPPELCLPPTSPVIFVLRLRSNASPATRDLADLLGNELGRSMA